MRYFIESARCGMASLSKDYRLGAEIKVRAEAENAGETSEEFYLLMLDVLGLLSCKSENSLFEDMLKPLADFAEGIEYKDFGWEDVFGKMADDELLPLYRYLLHQLNQISYEEDWKEYEEIGRYIDELDVPASSYELMYRKKNGLTRLPECKETLYKLLMMIDSVRADAYGLGNVYNLNEGYTKQIEAAIEDAADYEAWKEAFQRDEFAKMKSLNMVDVLYEYREMKMRSNTVVTEARLKEMQDWAEENNLDDHILEIRPATDDQIMGAIIKEIPFSDETREYCYYLQDELTE